MMRRLRATGFGPFRGNDGLTPRERRTLALLYAATKGGFRIGRTSVADIASAELQGDDE